jgi:hypothetical protein
MHGNSPDANSPDSPASPAAIDPLIRTERRLKVIDFFALIVAALIAVKISEHGNPISPLFLIGIGAYQIVISAFFLVLVKRRKRLGATVDAELLPSTVPLDTYADVRLNRWRRLSRRLPFQLDYVLRIVLGIVLIVWGLWSMSGA